MSFKKKQELLTVFGQSDIVTKIEESYEPQYIKMYYLGMSIPHNGKGLSLFINDKEQLFGVLLKDMIRFSKTLENQVIIIKDCLYYFSHDLSFDNVRILKLLKNTKIELHNTKKTISNLIKHNLIHSRYLVFNQKKLKSTLSVDDSEDISKNNKNIKEEKTDNNNMARKKSKDKRKSITRTYMLLFVVGINYSNERKKPNKIFGFMSNVFGKPAALCEVAVFGSPKNAFFNDSVFKNNNFYVFTNVEVSYFHEYRNVSLSRKSSVLHSNLVQVKWKFTLF